MDIVSYNDRRDVSDKVTGPLAHTWPPLQRQPLLASVIRNRSSLVSKTERFRNEELRVELEMVQRLVVWGARMLLRPQSLVVLVTGGRILLRPRG